MDGLFISILLGAVRQKRRSEDTAKLGENTYHYYLLAAARRP